MRMDKLCHYKTKDLNEAAFLYASNQKLAGLDKDSGKICWFVFDDRATCEKLAQSFWRRDAIVNAKEFADALRTLKDILFNKELR